MLAATFYYEPSSTIEKMKLIRLGKAADMSSS